VKFITCQIMTETQCNVYWRLQYVVHISAEQPSKYYNL